MTTDQFHPSEKAALNACIVLLDDKADRYDSFTEDDLPDLPGERLDAAWYSERAEDLRKYQQILIELLDEEY